MRAKEKYADKFVGVTPKEIEEFDHRHKTILGIFSKYNFNKILDVGCGDGNFSLLLKKACGAKEVCGIEISKDGIEQAKKKGIDVIQLNIDEDGFPFDDKYFNAIFAGEVIEHLFDPDHLLEECYRILRPNGLFVLTTRNLSSLFNRITLLLGYQPFPTSVSLKYNVGRPFKVSDKILGDHIRVFTYRAMRDLLELHNFKILEIKGTVSVLPKNKNMLLSLIQVVDKVLTKFPSLSQGVIFVCLKTSGYRKEKSIPPKKY